MFFGICRLNISRYHAWMLWEWFQILAWFIWFCFWFGVWNVFYFSEQKIDDSASISFPILLGSLNLNQKSWNDVIRTYFGGLIRLDTRKCMLFFWYPVNTGKIVQGLCCHSWWFSVKSRGFWVLSSLLTCRGPTEITLSDATRLYNHCRRRKKTSSTN